MFVYKINHVVKQNGAYDVVIWKKSTTTKNKYPKIEWLHIPYDTISKKQLLIYIVRLFFIEPFLLE
jgi:hypothetical protein